MRAFFILVVLGMALLQGLYAQTDKALTSQGLEELKQAMKEKTLQEIQWRMG